MKFFLINDAYLGSGPVGIGLSGGGGGIRTHGRLSPTSVFKTGAFNHSATPSTES